MFTTKTSGKQINCDNSTKYSTMQNGNIKLCLAFTIKSANSEKQMHPFYGSFEVTKKNMESKQIDERMFIVSYVGRIQNTQTYTHTP